MAKGKGKIVVTVEFEYPNGTDVDDAFQEVVEGMDYSMSYNKGGVKITDTEITDQEDAYQYAEEGDGVPCKFCGASVKVETAHLHDGSYVGECCWDERLRATQ